MKTTFKILFIIFLILSLRYCEEPNNIDLTILYIGCCLVCLFGAINIDNIKENNNL